MRIENLDRLFAGYSHCAFKDLFPNTILDERASFKMGCCIGFLYGLKLSGKTEEFEHYANNFISVFDHPYINPKEMTDSDRGYPTKEGLMPTPAMVCTLHDDGSALSFAFCIYGYNKDQSFKDQQTIEHGWWRDRYNFRMNGGIIFHGIQQQFSVTLDNKPGWQIHT
jgi:hypothetical protein